MSSGSLAIASTARIDDIRPGFDFDVSCRGTVPPAILAFLELTDYENAVRLAVSLGGDADTLGCITGGIAQAYYGGVPAEIRSQAPRPTERSPRFYPG